VQNRIGDRVQLVAMICSSPIPVRLKSRHRNGGCHTSILVKVNRSATLSGDLRRRLIMAHRAGFTAGMEPPLWRNIGDDDCGSAVATNLRADQKQCSLRCLTVGQI